LEKDKQYYFYFAKGYYTWVKIIDPVFKWKEYVLIGYSCVNDEMVRFSSEINSWDKIYFSRKAIHRRMSGIDTLDMNF